MYFVGYYGNGLEIEIIILLFHGVSLLNIPFLNYTILIFKLPTSIIIQFCLNSILSNSGSTDSYSVAVCEKLLDSDCKKDSAVCLATTQNKHVSLGLYESDTR